MDPGFLQQRLGNIQDQAARQPGGNRLAPDKYDEAYTELAKATPGVPFMPRTATNSMLQ